jgi:hypothetical protein
MPHNELVYSGHGMMYLGTNGGGLSDLSTSSSGSPMDLRHGGEYGHHHHHGNPLYASHPSNIGLGLGLGLDLSIYGDNGFLNGPDAMAGGTSREVQVPASAHRTSHEEVVKNPSTTSAATRKKRKLYNSNSHTPTMAAASMMPPPTPGVTSDASVPHTTATRTLSQTFHQPHQFATFSGPFENLSPVMGQFNN